MRANRGILGNLKEQLRRNLRPEGSTLLSVAILISAGVGFYLRETPPSSEPPVRRPKVGQ